MKRTDFSVKMNDDEIRIFLFQISMNFGKFPEIFLDEFRNFFRIVRKIFQSDATFFSDSFDEVRRENERLEFDRALTHNSFGRWKQKSNFNESRNFQLGFLSDFDLF